MKILRVRLIGCLILAGALMSACSGSGSDPAAPQSVASYSVGGMVTGLAGTLVLRNNGGDDITITTDGSFTFITPVADGEGYNVTVAIQPAGQLCTTSNSSGTVKGVDLSTVTITCSKAHTIGGTVSGLSGSGLVLLLNGGNDYPVTTNGEFSLAPLADGSGYTVTIKTQPTNPKQTCTIANGAGTLADTNITNVTVICSPWTKQAGAINASTWAHAVAADSNNNIYIAGSTTGGFDGNSLTGTLDYILAKYDASGNKIFIKQAGVGSAGTEAASITTDSAGNVYLAGFTTGGLDDNSQTGVIDYFLTKYDAAGNRLYTRQMGTVSGETRAASVAVDTTGNVYVAGYTQGHLDGNTRKGYSDYFLTKYDAAGIKVYTKQIGVSGTHTAASSVVADNNNNIYVAGYTTGNLDGNTLMGVYDYFLTKYDAAGNWIYTRQLGTADAITLANAATTDAHDNVYITGVTTSGLDGNTLISPQDIFVSKYNAITGEKLYTKQMGAPGDYSYSEAKSIVTDTAGNLFIAGSTFGGLNGNTLPVASYYFLTKLDASGAHVYTRQDKASGDSYNVATSATDDTSGNIFIAGFTQNTPGLEGLDGNLQTGNPDLFLVKYGNDGNKQ